MQTDPLGDFLTIIRNAVKARKKVVIVPHSKFKETVADVLKEEGFVDDVEIIKDKVKPRLRVVLRIVGKTNAINKIDRMSTPGLRKYTSAEEIPRVLGGLGMSVLSTSKGVMSGHKAKKMNLGGELLLTVS